MRHRRPLLLAMVCLLSGAAAAQEFETPPAESPGTILPPEMVSGPDFQVQDPVRSDGLMRRYVVQSRFGDFSAYGTRSLRMRLQEVAALKTIEQTSSGIVVLQSVTRGISDDVKASLKVATHPVGTVLGIPRGIAHLFGGYRARAQETLAGTEHALGDKADAGSGPHAGTGERIEAGATDAAKKYADHYLGLSAAERRWYARLNVDPYADNSVLRRAVQRLAKVDAAATFGMKFAPGVPFAGEAQKVLNAVNEEDPAVLRQRRHAALAAAGLQVAEIRRFEDTLPLSPTRQTQLVDAVAALNGVEGRDSLLRHASEITSPEEVQVFVDSTLMLAHYHALHPLARILPGLRIPAAQDAAGTLIVFGAFDDVYWTRDVADYEQAARQALPAGPRMLLLEGAMSGPARAALEQLGWKIQGGVQPGPP